MCISAVAAVAVVTAYIGNTRAQDGKTALIVAAKEGYADCVRLLLDAGADAEVEDDVRHQPIASAVVQACWVSVELLLFFQHIEAAL